MHTSVNAPADGLGEGEQHTCEASAVRAERRVVAGVVLAPAGNCTRVPSCSDSSLLRPGVEDVIWTADADTFAKPPTAVLYLCQASAESEHIV